MKRLPLLFIGCLFSVGVFSQTGQGAWTVGGLVKFSSSSNSSGTEQKTTSFNLSPSIGYLVADNMEGGLSLGFGRDKYELYGNDNGSSTIINIQPYFRYYLFTSNEKFAIMFRAAVGYAFIKREAPENSILNDSNGKSLAVSLSPGFSYFFTDNIGLNFELEGLSFSRYDPDTDIDDNESSSFNFGISSFNPSLGFKYYFAR